MDDKLWYLYIIKNKNCTYVGVSPDPVRRLRQHNGEIKGGAKYTNSKGKGWQHVCLIKGFKNKIQSMQFEWAVKHVLPRNDGGIKNRIKKLYKVLNKEYWTSKSEPANTIPLQIEWNMDIPFDEDYEYTLPSYVSEYKNKNICII